MMCPWLHNKLLTQDLQVLTVAKTCCTFLGYGHDPPMLLPLGYNYSLCGRIYIVHVLRCMQLFFIFLIYQPAASAVCTETLFTYSKCKICPFKSHGKHAETVGALGESPNLRSSVQICVSFVNAFCIEGFNDASIRITDLKYNQRIHFHVDGLTCSKTPTKYLSKNM